MDASTAALMTPAVCQFRDKPGGPPTCGALPDPRSTKYFCAAHRAHELREAAFDYRARLESQGPACARAWAERYGFDVAELEAVKLPDKQPAASKPGARSRRAG